MKIYLVVLEDHHGNAKYMAFADENDAKVVGAKEFFDNRQWTELHRHEVEVK